jgi:DNA-binding NarL/FixJ family response regulator
MTTVKAPEPVLVPSSDLEMSQASATTVLAEPDLHAPDERLRVLLIDDEPVIREALAELLEDLSFDVVGQGCDGAEGVDLAANVQADVIVMDMRMPGMDGLEATRRIKARDPNAQVVILSAYEDASFQKGAGEVGVACYLVKGCKANMIRDVLTSAANLHRGLAHREPTLLESSPRPPAGQN